MILKAELDEQLSSWDWIIGALVDDYNPAEMRRIRRECSYYEIAKAYAMKVYRNSPTLKQ